MTVYCGTALGSFPSDLIKKLLLIRAEAQAADKQNLSAAFLHIIAKEK